MRYNLHFVMVGHLLTGAEDSLAGREDGRSRQPHVGGMAPMASG
jgi:hypothetical protein